jgi:hypothetical protein
VLEVDWGAHVKKVILVYGIVAAGIIIAPEIVGAIVPVIIRIFVVTQINPKPTIRDGIAPNRVVAIRNKIDRKVGIRNGIISYRVVVRMEIIEYASTRGITRDRNVAHRIVG